MNKLKLRVAALSFITILLFANIGTAAQTVTANVTSDTQTMKITVSGKASAYNVVSFLVLAEGTDRAAVTDVSTDSKTAFYGESVCDASGAYTKTFALNSAKFGKGRYDIYVTEQNEGAFAKTTFTYSTTEAISSALSKVIADIKANAAETLVADITSYEIDLMLDFAEFKGFSASLKQNAASLIIGLLKNEVNIDISSFSEAFKKAVAITAINNKPSSEIYSLMDKYKSELGIDISKFDALGADLKAWALNIIEKNDSADPTAFQNRYKEAILCAYLTYPTGYAEIKSKITEYLSILNISMSGDYASLIDKDAVFKLMTEKTYNSTSDIEREYNSAVLTRKTAENAGNSNPNTNPSNGGGLAGGGSSGIISQGSGLSAALTPPNPQLGYFDDLAYVAWAVDSISSLYEKNIISGYGDRRFEPNGKVTRQEFAKIAVLAAGLYDDSAEIDFSDVDAGGWQYKYIASGVKSGIIQGIGDNKFGGNELIKREDMAVMLGRILKIRNISKPIDDNGQFNDVDEISDYAAEAVALLRAYGIIVGDNNNFNPRGLTTRAEAAVITDRFLKLSEAIQ